MAEIRTLIPLSLKNNVRVEMITFAGLSDQREHFAMRFPGWDQGDDVTVRLHSECVTGDVFGSKRCDCGAQLQEAIEAFSKEGGVLLYLRQEGRDIGLYEKMEAYRLQIEEGLDTYSANVQRGHPEDARSFNVAAEMLDAMGIERIELLSNNPLKAEALEASGIQVVRRRSTNMYQTEDNTAYLDAKQRKGHVFSNDEAFMQRALNLAAQGLGRTAPNPSVGCIIVKDGIVVGEGRTADGGHPHAETVALEEAGEKAAGATAYVTLEPCCHSGKTPPCTDALINARIARVVIACRDPDPRVAGQGFSALKAAAIVVDTDLYRDEAEDLNRGFFLTQIEKRPLVTLKIATSLDGRIALANGKSQWITGVRAREDAHYLRSRHDAIVTGIGTVLADDPRMTVRIKDQRNKPMIRIVMDRKGRLPEAARLYDDLPVDPLWIWNGKDLRTCAGEDLAGGKHSDCEIDSLLSSLAQNGVTRLLVEAGTGVTTSFVRSGFIDELYWYRAASVLGGDSQSAINALQLEALTSAPRYNLKEVRALDEDRLEIYTKAE